MDRDLRSPDLHLTSDRPFPGLSGYKNRQTMTLISRSWMLEKKNGNRWRAGNNQTPSHHTIESRTDHRKPLWSLDRFLPVFVAVYLCLSLFPSDDHLPSFIVFEWSFAFTDRDDHLICTFIDHLPLIIIFNIYPHWSFTSDDSFIFNYSIIFQGLFAFTDHLPSLFIYLHRSFTFIDH